MKVDCFNKTCLITAIVYYSVVAWFATGYFHADEHYQIIEFAGLKTGLSQANDLTWEFEAGIRSALQPGLAYLLISAFNSFTSNPYTQAFLLRFLTGLLALLAIRGFIKATLPKIKPSYQKLYIIASYFLWFIPFIFTRFSSEAWSGIFLIFALSLIFSKPKFKTKDALILGLFLGFAFLFRYQAAIAAVGMFAWLFFIRKHRFTMLFKSIVVVFGVIGLGILIDSWFYSDFTLTIWNYFNFNILKEGASTFGTSPVSWYVYGVLRFTFLPIGFLIGFAFLYRLIKNPKSLFLWVVVPFFIIHSLIPHKEIRFLFPIAFLVAPVGILFLQDMMLGLKTKASRFKKPLKIIGIVFITLLFACNILGLIIIPSKTAGARSIHIAKYIYDNYKDSETVLYHLPYSAVFEPFDVPTNFYKVEKNTSIEISSICNLTLENLTNNETTLLTFATIDKADLSCLKNNPELKFTKLTQSWPDWLVSLESVYSVYEFPEQAYLYKVELKR